MYIMYTLNLYNFNERLFIIILYSFFRSSVQKEKKLGSFGTLVFLYIINLL